MIDSGCRVAKAIHSSFLIPHSSLIQEDYIIKGV